MEGTSGDGWVPDSGGEAIIATGQGQWVDRPVAISHHLESVRDGINRAILRLALLGRMNPATALELVNIFEGACKVFTMDASFGICDAIRSALKVSPVEGLSELSLGLNAGARSQGQEQQGWRWIEQLCDDTACYSRAILDRSRLTIFNNERMEESFMGTSELLMRIQQLRLLPFFHWTWIIHPADIPVVCEALAPIMVGHGSNRQTDVVVKCRRKTGDYVPSLLTFRAARGPYEGKGGIVMRLWPLETRVFQPPRSAAPRQPVQQVVLQASSSSVPGSASTSSTSSRADHHEHAGVGSSVPPTYLSGGATPLQAFPPPFSSCPSSAATTTTASFMAPSSSTTSGQQHAMGRGVYFSSSDAFQHQQQQQQQQTMSAPFVPPPPPPPPPPPSSWNQQQPPQQLPPSSSFSSPSEMMPIVASRSSSPQPLPLSTNHDEHFDSLRGEEELDTLLAVLGGGMPLPPPGGGGASMGWRREEEGSF